ncbi:MAG: hypothetical protein ACXWC4_03300 [Telluria sp.]
MSDYIGTYFTDKGFDFHGLINDDFVQPVRLLFQNRHYVSAIKLLMIAIDSVGYVEFGDAERNPFISWVSKYGDMRMLGLTPVELWEHRNSLLHMSSLDSRKVRTGAVRRLVGYIGTLPRNADLSNADTGYYDMTKLILEVGNSLNRWIASYEQDREKIHSFVERYDRIASDARMMHVRFPG